MAMVPNISKMANAGMVDCSTIEFHTSDLSVAELEDLLKGKKAKIVELGEKKQTLQDQMVHVDREIEELTGVSSFSPQGKPALSRSEKIGVTGVSSFSPQGKLSRSEKMKEVWRKRRERQNEIEADRVFLGTDYSELGIRSGSLTHVILDILNDLHKSAGAVTLQDNLKLSKGDPSLTLDQIVQRVKKTKWRGRGGPIRQSVYIAIYGFNKKIQKLGFCDYIKCDKINNVNKYSVVAILKRRVIGNDSPVESA